MEHPSTYDQAPWIYIRAKNKPRLEKTDNCGKWLVFVDLESVDEVWQKIALAVYKGELGISAKVSTAMATPPDKKRVICVYSYDYTDKDDVMRIRQKLRDLDITWKIGYKTDAATKAGNYYKKGQRVCIYWE